MIALYLVVVAVTVGIFVGTLRLGRNRPPMTPTATTRPDLPLKLLKGESPNERASQDPPDEPPVDRH